MNRESGVAFRGWRSAFEAGCPRGDSRSWFRKQAHDKATETRLRHGAAFTADVTSAFIRLPAGEDVTCLQGIIVRIKVVADAAPTGVDRLLQAAPADVVGIANAARLPAPADGALLRGVVPIGTWFQKSQTHGVILSG